MAFEKDDHEILLETGTNELEIAEFGIKLKNKESKQTFGINVAKVREIIKLPSFINIPDVNANIIGLFKLREKVIPLINLASWLNAETKNIALESCYVIVTEFNSNNFGFLVHEIKTIHRVSWKTVLPPVNLNSGMGAGSITGIVPFKDRIMMMIDFEKIIADINPETGIKLETQNVVNTIKDDLGRGKKAIIAEDSELVRELLVSILKKGGFDVLVANNGKQAFDYLESLREEARSSKLPMDKVVNVVVSDIEMPQMDGHSLCKKIKEDPDLKEIPVVLFSSLIYEEMRKKGEAIGADAQISKPEISNLLSVVESLLKKKSTVATG